MQLLIENKLTTKQVEAYKARPPATNTLERTAGYVKQITRRSLLLVGCGAMARNSGPVIDIHQHTHYHGRTDVELMTHQRTMGIAKTVLLPAGSKDGLAVDAGGNNTVSALAKAWPDRYCFYANEAPDAPDLVAVLEKYLKAGAIGIGEQKFPVDCDSSAMQRIAEIARDYRVPVLMHFQHQTYNFGFERFHRMLEKYPSVNFIGHAQTWWGNIDKAHRQEVLYPRGPITPGGITDRLLSDYGNVFADMSAGSGLNALLRDEDHARDFLSRHQNRLLFGSDCDDAVGAGKGCSGSQQLATIRRLASESVASKILYKNARRLMPRVR